MKSSHCRSSGLSFGAISLSSGITATAVTTAAATMADVMAVVATVVVVADR
jgi:hypothetical protein